MTYCVAMRLDAGLVFLADSRTNAGVDHVGAFRKMTICEVPGERVITLMTSGNLSISQSVRQLVTADAGANSRSLWNVNSMYEAAQLVGDAIRQVFARDAAALSTFGIDFNIGMILGGQIKNEPCRLFMLYSAGNFIEAQRENPYFQIGEAKYGKPIIDRVVTPSTALDEAAKCALISMDSTLRSNISVGMPLDLLVYQADSLRVERFVTLDENNQYFAMIRKSWGQNLRQVFENLQNPLWHGDPAQWPNALTADWEGNRDVHLQRPPPAAPY
ncbi:proteasome-type protease [Massilia sp. W12]|uniref:proteasome-type protease n=1 Tax=Massilia sp. W12 TaxID=3126507 RepID=UPI0030CE3A2B